MRWLDARVPGCLRVVGCTVGEVNMWVGVLLMRVMLSNMGIGWPCLLW